MVPAKPKPAPLLPRAEFVLGDGAMGIREAANFCGLSEKDIKNRLARGELSSTRIGRRRLVPRRSLILMLAERFEPGVR